MKQALLWLAEEDTRRMIVPNQKALARLRADYPHIAHQLVPMPTKNRHNGHADIRTNIFIDEMHKADEKLISDGDLDNDQIKAWLGRPIIIDL